jgi:sporulation protein YlmC with PRC-barrel domain
MNSKILALGFSCLLCSLGTDARAEPPVAGKTTLGVTVSESSLVANGWRVSKLVGADIRNDKGDKIGKVDDIIVTPSGELSIAVVDVGGFLGIGSRRVAIPMRQLQITRDPSKIVLPGASKDALKTLPEFKYEKS